MGGQGGGVLADWVVGLAEAQGWAAQSTSVPGVAQRTGATIYYIEMAPPKGGTQPVFALMPTPGDVDIVMASELMEAGRSVLRGLVTPDRTTSDRLDPSRAGCGRETGAGRRRCGSRGRVARHRICRQTSDCLQHGGDGEGERKRHFVDDVRRARGVWSVAVYPRSLRGSDPRRRVWRDGKPHARSRPPSSKQTRKPIEPIRRFPEKRFHELAGKRRATPNSTGSASASAAFPPRRSR